MGLLGVDHNAQLPTEGQNNLEILEERLARGGLDKPVVEVTPHANTQRVEDGRNRSHDPDENLWGRGAAETQCCELINLAIGHKEEEGTRFQMYRNLKVSLPEIDGGHPVARTDGKQDRLNGLHLEV